MAGTVDLVDDQNRIIDLKTSKRKWPETKAAPVEIDALTRRLRALQAENSQLAAQALDRESQLSDLQALQGVSLELEQDLIAGHCHYGTGALCTAWDHEPDVRKLPSEQADQILGDFSEAARSFEDYINGTATYVRELVSEGE